MTNETLLTLLDTRTNEMEHEILFRFLETGEIDSERNLTYGQFRLDAQRVASNLQARGLQGERILLLYPAGLDYIRAFYGCLYAGATAVPAYPPQLNKQAERLVTLITQSGAKAVLTTPQILKNIEKRLAHLPILAELQWLSHEELMVDPPQIWQDPAISPDHIAFLQYTSGSTSTPKGVMLSHANLLNNLAQIKERFQIIPSDMGISWLPLYHDMGLIGGMLEVIYAGISTALMSPVAFLQRPFRWLHAISHFGGTIAGGPNFAYDVCVRKVTEEQKAQLDLSKWTLAFNGAEPVRTDTMARFAEAFASCGFKQEAFFPCYGLAEATLIVSGGDRTQKPNAIHVDADQLAQDKVRLVPADTPNALEIVSCGAGVINQELLIIDPATQQPAPAGQVGEIWVASDSVAQGYWQAEEATEKGFKNMVNGRYYLSTEDLGFLHEGELYVTGRVKELIIIRGRNYYPTDIEKEIEAEYEPINTCVACTVERNGEETLILVTEIERGYARPEQTERRKPLNPDELKMQVRQFVSQAFQLRAYDVVLVKLGALPRTSSGKLQRGKTAKMYEEDALKLW